MKICLATLRQEFRNSGEIESIVNLQECLRKNGIAADILTPYGFYVAAMPESRSGLHWRKAGDLWRLYRVLQQRSGDYDVIHLFLPFPALSCYGDFIKRKLRKKVVVTFESCMATLKGAERISFLRSEPLTNLLRFCINNTFFAALSPYAADTYIVSSKYQQGQLSKRKVLIIPNLTSTSRYKRTDKLKARKTFNFPNDAFVVSYIGHFLVYKGINDLLAAFAQLSMTQNGVRLALAFSGIGHLDKAKKLATKLNITDKVFFLGSVNVGDLLSASDLLAVPYHYSFGTNWIPSILLEGFSVGVPIVTSDLAPLRELNESREVLALARAGDHRHLASTISMLMNDGKKLEAAVRNQGELMYTTLNPDVLVKRYIKVYEMVLSEKD